VYYISDDGPKYLLIKRHALSGKIERVAPKGKVQKGEKADQTALREISEETGLPINKLVLKQEVGTTQLRSSETGKGSLNKDVTYFRVEYTGDPSIVDIIDGEGYIGIYKRASIQDVLELVYYTDMRELIRDAHMMITKQDKRSKVKDAFLEKL
jgi:8-oxo-dGTP pyrophosphatase MutT (NUDIX family)